jgi:hypothetical protein
MIVDEEQIKYKIAELNKEVLILQNQQVQSQETAKNCEKEILIRTGRLAELNTLLQFGVKELPENATHYIDPKTGEAVLKVRQ